MGVLARAKRRARELNAAIAMDAQQNARGVAYYLPNVFRFDLHGLDNECGAPLKHLVDEYSGQVEYDPPGVVSPVAQHCIAFSCAYAHVTTHKLLLKVGYRVTGVSVSEMRERKRFYSFYAKNFSGYRHDVCVFSNEGLEHPVKERGYFF